MKTFMSAFDLPNLVSTLMYLWDRWFLVDLPRWTNKDLRKSTSSYLPLILKICCVVNISTYQVDFHPDKLNVGVLVKHWMISDKHNIIFLQQSKVDISINHLFPFVPVDEFY